MKGMKGKFLRKLKFIPSLSTFKQGLVLQPDPQEKLYKEQDQKGSSGSPRDEDMELEYFCVGKKDNFKSSMKSKEVIMMMEDCCTHEAKGSEECTSLLDFEEKCPPGGSESIIFYTTSLRGIRKTFEDCNTIRFLLESFKVLFYERDVSMHLEYREELWKILGGRVIPPRLFIKGRCIGGADEVAGLHEQGKLRKLLEGIPLDLSTSCRGCANARFVVCLNCSGSRKIVADGENNNNSEILYIRCPECNENGLVQCPICC